MAVIIPNTFVNGFPAIATEVNENFSSVKTFVDGLADGTNIDSGSIIESKIASSAVSEAKIATNAVTEAKIAANAVTQTKIADRAVGSAELKEISLNPKIASYTAELTDAQKIVTMNLGTALTFSIPTDASVAFQIGDQINILQLGAGAVTIAAVTPGTTSVVSQGSKFKTNGQYAMATVVKVAANQWVVLGNLVA